MRISPLVEQFLASVAPRPPRSYSQRPVDEPLLVAALETLCNFTHGPRAGLVLPILLDLRCLQVGAPARASLVKARETHTEREMIFIWLQVLSSVASLPQACRRASTARA